MNSGMVKLKGLKPFSHGRYRQCYRHPDDPRQCIKIKNPDLPPELIRRRAPVWKRLRSIEAFDHNLRELRFYSQYERFYGSEIWRHVPRCHGLIETDLGPGLAVEYIGNADGTPAERLSRIIKDGGFSEIRSALDEFRDFLRRSLLLTHELRLQNLVVPRENDHSLKRIYIIDAIGLPDLLPVAYRWTWLARRRISGKLRRFEDRIMEARKETGK